MDPRINPPNFPSENDLLTDDKIRKLTRAGLPFCLGWATIRVFWRDGSAWLCVSRCANAISCLSLGCRR